MFVFCEWRATLIPLIACGVCWYVLRSAVLVLDQHTDLFRMVLSIACWSMTPSWWGENVDRLMREEHLSPIDATIRSMRRHGRVIVVATVLVAVFLRCFLHRIDRRHLCQFSITIVASMRAGSWR